MVRQNDSGTSTGDESPTGLLCPSARPQMTGCNVIGVVTHVEAEPRIAYLDSLQPATAEVLALASPARAETVFRFSAPCAGGGCAHFNGSACRLATRIVQILPRVVDDMPPCGIRPQCRWFSQEGKAACQRCPQIVTQTTNPSLDLVSVSSIG
jgi:hypothetical protein